MSISKATKALAVGTEGMLIVGPQTRYQRPANLPANWTRVRVSVLLSLTNLTDDNGTPNAEIITSGIGRRADFAFGLSNGVGMHGDAGNLFIGAGINNSIAATSVNLNTGNWRIGSTGTAVNLQQMAGNGTTVNFAVAAGLGLLAFHGDPTGTSGFCFGLMIDLVLNPAGHIERNAGGRPSLSETSDAALNATHFMTASAAAGAPTAAGWWPGSDADCQYFYLRNPFANNRIRIHNSIVQQLG